MVVVVVVVIVGGGGGGKREAKAITKIKHTSHRLPNQIRIWKPHYAEEMLSKRFYFA